MANFKFFLLLFVFPLISTSQSVKDVDGNSYNYFDIDGEKIFKTNLRTTRFNTGEKIKRVKNKVEWDYFVQNKQPAYFLKDNELYYNAFVVNSKKEVCPENWKVPSKEEWSSLSQNKYHIKEKKERKSCNPYVKCEIESLTSGDPMGLGLKMKEIEFTLAFAMHKDKQKAWDETFGIGHLCENCMDWNQEYSSKVACDKCKDERVLFCGKQHLCKRCDGNGFYFVKHEEKNVNLFNYYKENNEELAFDGVYYKGEYSDGIYSSEGRLWSLGMDFQLSQLFVDSWDHKFETYSEKEASKYAIQIKCIEGSSPQKKLKKKVEEELRLKKIEEKKDLANLKQITEELQKKHFSNAIELKDSFYNKENSIKAENLIKESIYDYYRDSVGILSIGQFRQIDDQLFEIGSGNYEVIYDGSKLKIGGEELLGNFSPFIEKYGYRIDVSQSRQKIKIEVEESKLFDHRFYVNDRGEKNPSIVKTKAGNYYFSKKHNTPKKKRKDRISCQVDNSLKTKKYVRKATQKFVLNVNGRMVSGKSEEVVVEEGKLKNNLDYTLYKVIVRPALYVYAGLVVITLI